MKSESIDRACEFLRRFGYEVLDRGCAVDVDGHRRSIDVVAYDRMYNIVVGVKVVDYGSCDDEYRKYVRKRRRNINAYAERCMAWCSLHGWRNGFRCDTVSVYDDGCIDHITGQTKGVNT